MTGSHEADGSIPFSSTIFLALTDYLPVPHRPIVAQQHTISLGPCSVSLHVRRAG